MSFLGKWPVSPDLLRPLVPPELEIDLWEGTTWIGVTPFTIRGIRPPWLPPLPLISRSHELNVRVYVHYRGVPGIWFLSLDASNPFAVLGARLGYALPYFRAEMELKTTASRISFHSSRTDPQGRPADFYAGWEPGSRLPELEIGTRDFFLIERYCLYSSDGKQLYRAAIHHQPWPLCTARLEHLSSSVIRSHRLPEPVDAPLVHAQAALLHVAIWPPVKLD